MSLINDALNKAQRDRAEPFASAVARTRTGYAGLPRPVRVKSLGFIWVNAAALGVLFIGAIVYLHLRPESAAGTAAPTTVSPSPADRATESALPLPAPSGVSPFAAAAPAASPAARSDYELAGMSTIGRTILLSVTRLRDKRSVWVPVGKTVGEITAVSFDPATDRAVIRVNGAQFTLALSDVGSAAGLATQPAE